MSNWPMADSHVQNLHSCRNHDSSRRSVGHAHLYAVLDYSKFARYPQAEKGDGAMESKAGFLDLCSCPPLYICIRFN